MKIPIKKSTKIVAFLSLLAPILYLTMYLPIWDGKELPQRSLNIADYIQIISFILALIDIYLLFFKKKNIKQTVFIISFFISTALLLFFGIFFVENLMGIPPFPPQD